MRQIRPLRVMAIITTRYLWLGLLRQVPAQTPQKVRVLTLKTLKMCLVDLCTKSRSLRAPVIWINERRK